MAIIQTQNGACLAERGLAGANSMGERDHESPKRRQDLGGSQDVPWALKWLPGYNKAAIVMTIVITGVNAMASINIRIDDELKARAYHALEKLGITPSELMRQTLQYVAERGQLPFRPVLMTEEDEAMIATVRDRLAGPQRVKVALDDL